MIKSQSDRVSHSWGSWWKAVLMVGQNRGLNFFPTIYTKSWFIWKKYLPRLPIKWHFRAIMIMNPHTDRHGGTTPQKGFLTSKLELICLAEFT